MTDQHGYILAKTATDAESVRLALLENHFDPGTIRRLDTLNIATGSRCLEVGAGRGSIAQWLSGKVGPHGTVVAADIDCRLLSGLPSNVEVRTVDIRRGGLETDTYDLVHCRALLTHLPDPRSALRHMAAALRPGGVLLAEEPDFAMVAYGGHPDAQWCTETTHRIFESLAAAKVHNAYLGRELPGLMVEVGLDLLGGEAEGAVGRPGDVSFDLWRLTMDAIGPGLVAADLLSDSDRARIHEVMTGPPTVVTTLGGVAAWGRRVS